MKTVLTTLLLFIVIGCIEEGKKFPVTQPLHKSIDSVRIDTLEHLTTIVLDSTGRFKRIIYGGCAVRIVNDMGKNYKFWSDGKTVFRSMYYLKNQRKYHSRKSQTPIHMGDVDEKQFWYPYLGLNTVGSVKPYNIFGTTDTFKTRPSEAIENRYVNDGSQFRGHKHPNGINISLSDTGRNRISAFLDYPHSFEVIMSDHVRTVMTVSSADSNGVVTVKFLKSRVHFIDDSTFTFKSNK